MDFCRIPDNSLHIGGRDRIAEYNFLFCVAVGCVKCQVCVKINSLKTGKNCRRASCRDADFEAEVQREGLMPSGTLYAKYTLASSLADPKYYSHFTLSKFENGTFRLMEYDEDNATWSNLLKNGLRLDTGYYMLVTGTRMASGAVLSRISFFTITEGKDTTIALVMRQSKDQVQVIGNFNSEAIYRPVELSGDSLTALSDTRSILQACGRGYFVVGILGVGQEPTNHALRDIAALGPQFEEWGRKMVLLFPSDAQMRKFQPSEFSALPSTVLYGIDAEGKIQQQIVESMKLSGSSSLPIFIIADTFNRVVFVSQGYTIGLGEQLMKVIHGL